MLKKIICYIHINSINISLVHYLGRDALNCGKWCLIGEKINSMTSLWGVEADGERVHGRSFTRTTDKIIVTSLKKERITPLFTLGGNGQLGLQESPIRFLTCLENLLVWEDSKRTTQQVFRWVWRHSFIFPLTILFAGLWHLKVHFLNPPFPSTFYQRITI